MEYRLQLSAEAVQALTKLEKAAAWRITQRLGWLAQNIGNIKPEPLKGEYSGFYKYRIGDYRAIYFISHPEQTIFVRSLGHRSNVYKMK